MTLKKYWFVFSSYNKQVCRDINKIKICMETGRTVILLNMENLYESLYDALNQVIMIFEERTVYPLNFRNEFFMVECWTRSFSALRDCEIQCLRGIEPMKNVEPLTTLKVKNIFKKLTGNKEQWRNLAIQLGHEFQCVDVGEKPAFRYTY